MASYLVYWRLTDANQWQFSRFVGKVDHYQFTNLVVDVYDFGVSAVANNGAETPVVFPGPMGSFGDSLNNWLHSTSNFILQEHFLA